MTRIETLKLMGFSHEEAVEKAEAEERARVAFRNTKVSDTEDRIVVSRKVRDAGQEEIGVIEDGENWLVVKNFDWADVHS